MRRNLFLLDLFIGILVLFFLTCSSPLSPASKTRPYAFSYDSPTLPLSVYDTSAFSAVDTITIDDTIAFIGVVFPNDSRVKGKFWSFDDGTRDSNAIVRRRLASSGVHYAVFSIYDDVGDTLSDTVIVCVNTPPDSVILLSPVKGSIDEPYTPSLSWKGHDRDIIDSVLKYLVIINKGNGFVDTVVNWSKTTGTVLDRHFKKGDMVFWKVIAKDAFGASVASDTGKFTVYPSSDATLSNLILPLGKGLMPPFSPNDTIYWDTVPHEATSMDLEFSPTGRNATIAINDSVLPAGATSATLVFVNVINIFNITILSADTSTRKTYVLNIIQALSDNALLSSLKASIGTSLTNFSDSVFNYTDTVPVGTSSVTITPTAQDSSSKISVDGKAVNSQDTSVTVSLHVGKNEISITVTAPDEKTKKTYNFSIVRLGNSITTLSSLKILAGTVTSTVNAPIADTLKGIVGFLDSIVIFTPTATDTIASIIANTAAVKSGASSTPIVLKVGKNDIPITVTASDGKTKKTYIVSLTREANPTPSLASLKISSGTIKIMSGSLPDTLKDTVSFLDSVITLSPAAPDTQASIFVDSIAVKSGAASRSIALPVGTTKVQIKVTLPNNPKSKLYVLIILRKADGSVLLTTPPAGIAAGGISVSAVQITWGDVAEATYYMLQRSRQPASGFSTIGSPTGNSYIDTGLDSGSVYYYRVNAANSKGATAFSAADSAVTFHRPSITIQPQSQTVPEGSRAIFSVIAAGIPAPVYQWQKNKTDIATAQSAACTTSVLALSDNGSRYRCIIRNGAGVDSSTEAVLTVDSVFTKPSILTQPHDTSVAVGNAVSLIVTISGTNAAVQWRKDGVDLQQAKSCTLSISGAQTTDAGIYSVKVWNRIDSANSLSFRLRVLPKIPTGLSAQARSAMSIGVTWNQSTGAAWYRLLRASGTSAFASICSTAQTNMVDTLLIEGTSYSYKVSAGNSDGESVAGSPITASTFFGPKISQQPQAQSLLAGETINISVTATGLPACSYQWKKDGVILPGATSAQYSLVNAAPADSGDYTVVITNPIRAFNSSAAHVSVLPLLFTTAAVPSIGGTITRSKTAASYVSGDSVRLTAHAAAGYRFIGWGGDTVASDTSILVILRKNRSINANFFRQYKLTVSIGLGKGTTTLLGDSVCDSGTTIQVTATPDAGYKFSGWAGDTIAADNNLIMTMTADRAITARFWKQFNLYMSSVGNGSVDPKGTTVVDSGISTTIKATADSGYAFKAWRSVHGLAAIGDSIAASTTVQLHRDNEMVEGVFKILTFKKIFGGAYHDEAYCIQQTRDKGLIIVGSTDLPDAGSAISLIKTNRVGDTIWTKMYNDYSNSVGYSVQQTSDDGYIICGSAYINSDHQEDMYLMKTDASGVVTWKKFFGSSKKDVGRFVQQTIDGGYIIAGSSASFGQGDLDMYVVKTDANGIEEWHYISYSGGDDEANCVRQTSDGEYIVVGTGLGESESYVVILTKIHYNGDGGGVARWTKNFGGDNTEKGYSVLQTNDGGYIISGSSYEEGNGKVYIIKTDVNGENPQSGTFGGGVWDEGYSLQPTSDGGYILAGTSCFANENCDMYLVKIGADGLPRWEKTFDGSYEDHGYSASQTSDGGYVIVGTIRSATGANDVFLIKTDENGNIE